MMFLFKRNLKEATDVACFMFSGRSFQGSNRRWKEEIIEKVCICTYSLNVIRISEIVSDCCLNRWGNQFSQIIWRKPIHNFVEYD